MSKLSLQLTLTVNYDVGDTTPDKLHSQLSRVPNFLSQEGMMSGDNDATVADYEFVVKDVTPNKFWMVAHSFPSGDTCFLHLSRETALVRCRDLALEHMRAEDPDVGSVLQAIQDFTPEVNSVEYEDDCWITLSEQEVHD